MRYFKASKIKREWHLRIDVQIDLTLPKFKIYSPWKLWLEYYFPIGGGQFSGAMSNFRGVNRLPFCLEVWKEDFKPTKRAEMSQFDHYFCRMGLKPPTRWPYFIHQNACGFPCSLHSSKLYLLDPKFHEQIKLSDPKIWVTTLETWRKRGKLPCAFPLFSPGHQWGGSLVPCSTYVWTRFGWSTTFQSTTF